MNSCDAKGKGNIARDEIDALSQQDHQLMRAAISIQGKVRERAFGMTFNWEKIESQLNVMPNARSLTDLWMEKAGMSKWWCWCENATNSSLEMFPFPFASKVFMTRVSFESSGFVPSMSLGPVLCTE